MLEGGQSAIEYNVRIIIIIIIYKIKYKLFINVDRNSYTSRINITSHYCQHDFYNTIIKYLKVEGPYSIRTLPYSLTQKMLQYSHKGTYQYYQKGPCNTKDVTI